MFYAVIVGSELGSTLASYPKKHSTYESAEKEMARLAEKFPGKTFYIMRPVKSQIKEIVYNSVTKDFC